MTKRVALYTRVSTADGQTVENQLHDLHAIAARQGWTIVATFADEGISGAKGRDKRPGLDALMKGIARREFDMVAAWSVCRIGRSLQHLVGFLGDINTKRIDLYLHVQGIDTSTPSGRAMFQMLGVFAELERSLVSERVKTALSRLKAEGKRLGRPPLAYDKDRQIRKLLAQGMSLNKTAQKAKVGIGTVHRIKQKMQAAA